MRKISIVCLCAVCIFTQIKIFADPPYSETGFLNADILTENDTTTFVSITYTGQGDRLVYDRRVTDWITINAHLFDIVYSDGIETEAQVNPEFNQAEAMEIAEYYAREVGRIPKVLRVDVDALWIHQGNEPFGGGNSSILIHREQGDDYISGGWLHEILMHEAAHTSLDTEYYANSAWTDAQMSDPEYISTYARDNPNREDVAESFVPYVAIRYHADRITAEMKNTIETTMPARIAVFDSLISSTDMGPVGSSQAFNETMYLMTNSTSNNVTTLHILNSSNAEQNYYGTLYNGTGEQQGSAGVSLSATAVPASGRLKLSASDLEGLFGVTAWSGPAMLEVGSDGEFHLMSKLQSPSGFVSNTNCVREREIHNIEGVESANKTFVRLINTGTTELANITATLYDENGVVIGSANTEILASLSAKQQSWLNRDQIASLFESWTGEATLKVNGDNSDLKLLNLNFVNDETFFNFSCYEGS